MAAKLEARVTVELDTADLDEVGQAGSIAARAPDTKVDVRQVHSQAGAKVMIATEMQLQVQEQLQQSAPTIVDMPEQHLGAAVAQRDVRTQYVRRISTTHTAQPLVERMRGGWVVLLVYAVAIAALALSIYFRFYA